MKALRFYSVLLISGFILFAGGLILLFFMNRDRVRQWIANAWGKCVLKGAGIDLKTSGLEHFKSHPAIIITNHQSMLDLFIMCSVLPLKTSAIAKNSFKHYPLLGWFMRAVGIVFVDRYHRERALEAMKEARAIIEKGTSLLMAPEGTRTHTGELQPFKKGAFYLALQTKLPIIPVVIGQEAFRLLPRSRWTPQPGTVTVRVLPPISTAEWTQENLDDQIESVRQIYLEWFQNDLGMAGKRRSG